ncbi:hypothetical protein EVAR_99633_1 [Eumeta japonica]|uniref:Uncharacterized protein n=1 Tax=Eumeta variegata TaxID=151549 RepID=A0A4C2A0N8_EUMVA|nr:hypothetical protein EVAR_99633_1 [Eumeta japonica]
MVTAAHGQPPPRDQSSRNEQNRKGRTEPIDSRQTRELDGHIVESAIVFCFMPLVRVHLRRCLFQNRLAVREERFCSGDRELDVAAGRPPARRTDDLQRSRVILDCRRPGIACIGNLARKLMSSSGRSIVETNYNELFSSKYGSEFNNCHKVNTGIDASADSAGAPSYCTTHETAAVNWNATTVGLTAPPARRLGCGWESLMKNVTLGNVTMSHRTREARRMPCVSLPLNYDRSAALY